MINRDNLFITIRDSQGNLLDPVNITCSTQQRPACAPERLSKGKYLVAEGAFPVVSDGYIIWKVQEFPGDKTVEIYQASDGGLLRFEKEGDCNTGSTPGMSFLESLKRYPTARAKLLNEVPEILEDIKTIIGWKNSDPRDEYGRFAIVILRPSGKGYNSWISGIGAVDTKQHSFSVITSFEDYKYIDETETWDPTWKWIRQ